MEKLAEALREAMMAKRHSLRDAAEEMGVAHNTVTNWSKGWITRSPRLEHVNPLARYIGVTREEILGWLEVLTIDQVESLLEHDLAMRPYVNSGLGSAA